MSEDSKPATAATILIVDDAGTACGTAIEALAVKIEAYDYPAALELLRELRQNAAAPGAAGSARP